MTIERAKLRDILIELFRSDKKLMAEVVEEVNKQTQPETNTVGIDDDEMDFLIKRNLERYNEVYKALA